MANDPGRSIPRFDVRIEDQLREVLGKMAEDKKRLRMIRDKRGLGDPFRSEQERPIYQRRRGRTGGSV